jgi:hypothetical protein
MQVSLISSKASPPSLCHLLTHHLAHKAPSTTVGWHTSVFLDTGHFSMAQLDSTDVSVSLEVQQRKGKK